jgi:voltage-gated potassium channel
VNQVSTTAIENKTDVGGSLRQHLYRLLETAHLGDRGSRIVDIGLIGLICISVAAVVLESMARLELRWSSQFYWLEVTTVCIFSVEYLLRVWCSVEAPASRVQGASALQIRARYVLSFHAIIDLLAILPFYLMLLGMLDVDMRFLRAVRLLRILKLTRYSTAIDMLIACIVENGRSLAASFFILLVVMLLAAAGIYYFERTLQPVAFGSIPAAMWWAFVTLTTVGYGDVTPVTVGGRIFGAMIMVIGIGMVALPTGILASGYAQQLNQRQAKYRQRADEALDDGILSDEEVSSLEKLRIDLGLGRNTASQILDAGKVERALALEKAAIRCAHCGRMPSQ